MKKIENKFIIFIIFFITVVVIGILGFSFISGVNKSTQLYVSSGSALVNGNNFLVNERTTLNIGDKIQTLGEESVSIIEWEDGSVTRLGGDTYVEITNMYFSDNLSQINVSFELVSGKTWSNIISFLGSESSFEQTFGDNSAAVRGTVFAVDLENEYINVLNHEIELTTSSGEEYIIPEGKPFSLSNFSFIALEEFIKNIKDKSWESFNKKVDKEFILKLKQNLVQDLAKLEKIKLDTEKISDYSTEQKDKLYAEVLETYQRLNFLDSEDPELFSKKIEYKKYLLNIADTDNKKDIIRSFSYDFKDSIDSKNYSSIDDILKVLGSNTSILKDLNINLADYVNFDFVPEGLKDSFENNIDSLKSLFGEGFNLQNFNFDSLKTKGEELRDNVNSSLRDRVQQFRDRLDNNQN